MNFISEAAYVLPLQICHSSWPGFQWQQYPRYVFIPNKSLGNLSSNYNSFIELLSYYDMFDKLGIHNTATKSYRSFSVFTDTSIPDKNNNLSCLKECWEMGRMTVQRNERCYFADYLLNTFQQVLNITVYFSRTNVLRNLTAFNVGAVIVQKAINTFRELQNNMLSQLGEVTREVL
jgi:hypothetical protein